MIRKRSEPVIIKKYGNRRLYDTQASRYVTLQEVEVKIRGGTDVRVIDAKSGADLTQPTLVQIIFEGRGAARMLPVSLLLQLIRLGDEALAEFAGRWLSAALDIYMRARQSAQRVAPYNPFANMPFDLGSALARMLMGQASGTPGWGDQRAPGVWPDQPGAAGWSGPPVDAQPESEPELEPGVERPSEVDELRRELEELKAAFHAGEEESPPRRRPAAAARRKKTAKPAGRAATAPTKATGRGAKAAGKATGRGTKAAGKAGGREAKAAGKAGGREAKAAGKAGGREAKAAGKATGRGAK